MSINNENTFGEPIRKEINLRFLGLFILKKRMLALVAALVFAIAELLLILFPLIENWNNTEYMNTLRYQYNNELSAYTTKVETLKKEIDTISGNLAKQTTYNTESLRMKIDPYHKAVAQLIYYIDTGYRIIPENTYQDIDYSSRLIKMYMAYLTHGNAYSQLMEQFPEIKQEQYASEIMEASSDERTSTITLTIIDNDKDTAQAMLNVIRAGMQEVYVTASDTIIEHTLSVINDTIATVVDTALAEQQQKSFEQVVVISNLLEQKNTELEKLQNQGEPQWEYTRRSVVVKLLKNVAIAGILGLAAALLLIALFYIVSDIILDIDKLQSLSIVNILGVIPQAKPKRIKLFFRAVARICGGKRQGMDRDAALAATAQSICAAVLAKGTENGGVALAGSIGADALREFADALSGAVADERVRFAAAGDPIRDAAAVEAITASEFVVIVEKQNVSKCSDVVKEITRICAWGKPVLGAVLLDADEI